LFNNCARNERLEAMLIKISFDDAYENLSLHLSNYNAALKDISQSQALSKFLKLSLSIGNILNSESDSAYRVDHITQV